MLKKSLKKVPFNSLKKFSRPFFLVIDNFFIKNGQIYFLFFVFFGFFSVLFFLNEFFLKILMRLLGGQKKVFCPPHPNYWGGGACPGCPPESTPMCTNITNISIFLCITENQGFF